MEGLFAHITPDTIESIQSLGTPLDRRFKITLQEHEAALKAKKTGTRIQRLKR